MEEKKSVKEIVSELYQKREFRKWQWELSKMLRKEKRKLMMSQKEQKQKKPLLYTVKQASALLSINRESLRILCRNGEIVAARTKGGHWRIPRSALTAYIRKLRGTTKVAKKKPLDSNIARVNF